MALKAEAPLLWRQVGRGRGVEPADVKAPSRIQSPFQGLKRF